MTTQDELVAWLRTVLDEDKQVAEAAAERNPAPWSVGGDGGWVVGGETSRNRYIDGGLWDNESAESLEMEPSTAAHVALQDPREVSARVDAEWAILNVHAEAALVSPGRPMACVTCVDGLGEPELAPCSTVRAVAYGHRYRAGWRDEWAPRPL